MTAQTSPATERSGADPVGPARAPTPKPSKRTAQARNQRTAQARKKPTESPGAAAEFWRYQIDAWQRSVLFLDTLRERANNMIEHESAGLPPLLDFEYETVLDARTFDPQVNYALLRITAVGDSCLEDCLDESKPPVIVVDPRAGHGPGIGGFKSDSEVGIAMHAGHPVYFVIFFPEPRRDQTLMDVLHALRRFVEFVKERHTGKPPVLYGNCQAGWAITLLAADCAGLSGPAVLNGSPLSYWAGESGVNPMRVAGGLTGGAWLPHFLADLGDGRFDGAWLAQNFENLKPEKSLWDKYAKLFSNIDTERERFLDFERWWNGFYMLGREEILAIVENLFIGNKLERGKVRICENCFADLRRIRNPLVVFASSGDNITPPQQALGWIPAVYANTEDLKKADQRIVYLINPHVGHLGIFVSAKVARFEHRAILESLDRIEALEPGLYEMKIDNPTGDPDCHKSLYSVAFEPREVEDLVFDYPEEAFERVQEVSERNAAAYRAFVSPWVQAISNPWTATTLKWLHPMRTSRLLFSEKVNPWMAGIATLASLVDGQRQTGAAGNPYLEMERTASEIMSDAFTRCRQARDQLYETTFERIYQRGESQNGR